MINSKQVALKQSSKITLHDMLSVEEVGSDVSILLTPVGAGIVKYPTVLGVFSQSATASITSTTVPWPLCFDTSEISDHGITKGASGTVTISIADPAVISWPDHGLFVDSPVVFTSDGDLPTGITAGTVYYIIAAGFGEDSFQISTTPKGAAVVTTGTQSGVHTATNSSVINIPSDGVYGFIFSTMCDVTSPTPSTIDIWFRLNGLEVDRSNTRIQLTNQNTVHINIADVVIPGLSAGDRVEMFWVGSSTNNVLLAVAAQENPTRPATPSTILTVKKLST